MRCGNYFLLETSGVREAHHSTLLNTSMRMSTTRGHVIIDQSKRRGEVVSFQKRGDEKLFSR